MQDLSRRALMGVGAATVAAASTTARSARVSDAKSLVLPPPMKTRFLAMLASRQMPAVAIALVKDGAPLLIDSLGQASIPFGVAATNQTLFHIGSASKQFTAAAVLRLAQEGRIGLDDPIGAHARDLPPNLASLPIRALLSHTSGAVDYAALAGNPEFGVDRPMERKAFLAAIGPLKPDFGPGEAWDYSNTGYVLLGYLIADVTGRSYSDVVTDELLRGAKLSEARVDDAPALIANRAEPYALKGGVLRHEVMMDGAYSASADGAVLMSATDAARWEIALQSGSPISSDVLRQMTSPVMLSTGRGSAYGFGWFTDQCRGRVVNYHSGSVPGYLAFYLRLPTERIGAMVMTNVGSGAAAAGITTMAQELVEYALPGSTYLSLSPVPDAEPALTAQARNMLSRGRSALDPALFAPEIARPLNGRAGQEAEPPNLTARHPMDAFDLVEVFDEGTGIVRRYRAAVGADVHYWAFAYTPDRKIFRFRPI